MVERKGGEVRYSEIPEMKRSEEDGEGARAGMAEEKLGRRGEGI